MAACGERHTLFLDSSGKVYGCGQNDDGQLGFSEGPIEPIGELVQSKLQPAIRTERSYCTRKLDIPIRIQSLCDIIMIACGKDHSACLSSSGDLFTFGSNSKGQLGRRGNTIYPKKATSNVSSVACGDLYTMCIKQGRVYACGLNDNYQLGLPKKPRYVTSFQLVQELENITSIKCCFRHSLCLDNSGEVFYFGKGLNLDDFEVISPSAIGKFKQLPEIESIACGRSHSLLLTADGIVLLHVTNNVNQRQNPSYFPTMDYISGVVQLKGLPEIQYIYSAGEHCFFLDYNRKLWAFGDNSKGQIGLSNTVMIDKIVNLGDIEVRDVACGYYRTLLKTTTGIWGCGENTDGQLGLGRYSCQTIIQKVDGIMIFALDCIDAPEKIDSTILTRMGDDKSADLYSLFWGEPRVYSKSARK